MGGNVRVQALASSGLELASRARHTGHQNETLIYPSVRFGSRCFDCGRASDLRAGIHR
jgi:hypothetical protein